MKWGTVVHLGAARGALVVKRYTDRFILSELVYSGLFNDLFGLLRRSSPNGGSHNRLHQRSYMCPVLLDEFVRILIWLEPRAYFT